MKIFEKTRRFMLKYRPGSVVALTAGDHALLQFSTAIFWDLKNFLKDQDEDDKTSEWKNDMCVPNLSSVL
jgi:hypothetical protein